MAEPLNATFFAFRKREPGGALLRISIAFLIGMVVLVAAFAGLFWTSIGPLVGWYGQIIAAAASQDSAAMANVPFPTDLFTVVGGLLLWLFPVYILCAAYEAGCLRWMIHGETDGFMGLSLGAPTWRVWSCYWLWFLLNMAFSIVMQIVMTFVIGVIAVGSSGDPMATMTALPAVMLLQYVLMIYFAVRFAPAAATSVARRKFSFFEAWTVTKGRFWALFGAFFLIYLLYMVAGVALAAVWFSTVLGGSGVDLSGFGVDQARTSEIVLQLVQSFLQSFANPQTWIVLGVLQLVSIVLAMLLYIAMFGANARAAMAALEEGKIKPAEA
jgi:hypothetical protein